MDEKYPSPRGLINDLVRTITAAIVHMDDMLLNSDRNLEEFDDAILADEQLCMALRYLIELRSLIIGQTEYEHKDKKQNLIVIQDKINLLNNFLTAINISIDFLLKSNDKTIKSKIAKNILNSIDIIKPLINEYYQEPAIKIMKKYIFKKTEAKNIIRHNKKIMLVEDQYCIIDIIHDFLTKNGYIVYNCKTGEEAISLFEEHGGNFFLLIVDVCLPDINGYDLCRQFALKKPDIKILFTSGSESDIITKGIIDFRDSLFLSKPFRLDALLSIINNIN
jgi:CheY-like chemotaxis protein